MLAVSFKNPLSLKSTVQIWSISPKVARPLTRPSFSSSINILLSPSSSHLKQQQQKKIQISKSKYSLLRRRRKFKKTKNQVSLKR